jgi:hypothetical protein
LEAQAGGQEFGEAEDQWWGGTQGATFPWASLRFGYSISGTTVTIYAGSLFLGKNAAVSTSNADRTISADYQYVGVEYTFSTAAIAIGSPTTVEPVPTDTIFKQWLFQFRLQDGVVSLHRIGSMGNIYLPAVFGD